MAIQLTTLDELNKVLDHWKALSFEMQAELRERQRALGYRVPEAVAAKMIAGEQKFIAFAAEKAQPHLACFLEDNSDKSPEELDSIAAKLSPGGAHTGGLLARLIRGNVWDADPLLLAAVFYHNWHGGKLGFQFLPDPAETDLDDYADEAEDLMALFDDAFDDPRRVLTGNDRAFYDSLPERFTIYRGCAGVTPEQAAWGVCWTVSREVAEWFACRSAGWTGGAEPHLLTARIPKHQVRLVKASEFEVVTIPRKARRLKCRKYSEDWRPQMEWAA